MKTIPEQSSSLLKSYCKLNLVYQLAIFWVFLLLLFTSPSLSFAELRVMDDSQLKSATAQVGFTTFTLSNNTAQLFLDIHIETYTTIQNFSAGYYDKGGLGWDLHWQNVSLGTSTSDPLTIDGLLFVANFDDLSADNPKLQRIVFGSNRLQGKISADFLSYSGMYNPSLIGLTGDPVTVNDRTALQLNPPSTSTTFNFDSNATKDSNQGLFFILNMSGPKIGVQVVAGYDSKTLTSVSTPWWNSP
jgi:hypothetical protein